MQPAFSSKPSVVELLKALRRRWVLPLFIGILCAVPTAAAAWFLLPAPKHTVRSIVEFSDNTIYFKLPEHDGFNNLHNFQRSQVAILKSNKLLNRALKDEEVGKIKSLQDELEPVQWLEQRIQVDFPMGPQFLRVSMSGDNAEDLVTLVKTVTSNYVDQMQAEERKSRQTQFENIKSLYSQFRSTVEQKQKKYEDLASRVGINKAENMAIIQKLTLETIKDKKKEFLALLPKVRDLKRDLKSQLVKESWLWRKETAGALLALPAQSSPLQMVHATLLLQEGSAFDRIGKLYYAEILDEELIQKAMNKDPKLLEYYQSVERIKQKIDHYKTVIKGTSTQEYSTTQKYIKRLQKDGDAYARALADYKEKLHAKIGAELYEQARLQSKAKLLHLQLEHDSLIHLQDMLVKEITSYKEQSVEDTKRAINLGWLEAEIEQERKMFGNIATSLKKLEVEKDRLSRVHMWQEPVVYRGQPGSKQYLMTGAAGFGALGLILLGFAWLEFRKHKIDSPDDVVQSLGMRIVGTLPDFSYQKRNRLIGYGHTPNEHWQSMLTDSVDATRALLLHAADTENLKAVMVTSAVPGEGKTSSSAHLAASLARAGRKTLLIDSDLRKPSIHQVFDLSRGPGLSELLREEIALKDSIRQTSVENLEIITAGHGNHAALLAVAQGKFSPILDQLKGDYDFVVIDSPPVLHVPDSLVFAQYADATVFAVLREVSQLTKVYAAYQKLAMLDCRILGAIVNGTRDDIFSYKSKYSYYAVEPEE